MDGSSRYAVFSCQLAKAHSTLPVTTDGSAVEIKGRPTDVPAFKASAPHAGAHSLDDQVAFEFSDRSDDHDDGAAQRAARVDLFAEADELDVEPVELVQHLEEMPGGAGDAIGCPDQDHIEASPTGIPHHVIQTWPARLCAGDPVGVLLRNFIAALSGHLP